MSTEFLDNYKLYQLETVTEQNIIKLFNKFQSRLEKLLI